MKLVVITASDGVQHPVKSIGTPGTDGKIWGVECFDGTGYDQYGLTDADGDPKLDKLVLKKD